MTVPVLEKLVSILLLTIKGIDTLPPRAGGGVAETSNGAVSAQMAGTADGPHHSKVFRCRKLDNVGKTNVNNLLGILPTHRGGIPPHDVKFNCLRGRVEINSDGFPGKLSRGSVVPGSHLILSSGDHIDVGAVLDGRHVDIKIPPWTAHLVESGRPLFIVSGGFEEKTATQLRMTRRLLCQHFL